ncbi:MAG: hypothetical protein Q7W55_13235 [Pseudohongiella sp.]|nr:hypothetical protein [Pseudohongiella sp.]
MPTRNSVWFAAGTLILSLLMASLSVFIALTTARLDLQKDLTAQLPERLTESLRYSFADREVFSHVNQQILEDLQQIRIEGLLPVLQTCNTGLLRLSQHVPEARNIVPASRRIAVNWSRGSEIDQAEFSLDCQLNYPVLIGANLTMALLLMSCWWLLPVPLCANQKKMFDALRDRGIQAVYIRQILQKLNASELEDLTENQWFMLAMRRYASAEVTLETALAIVAAKPSIHFHHSSHHVLIHGISIALPKTPYFYYAWYAMQRVQNIDDGWILNPAADRPDRRQATALITLMENFGGHQKAINDLKEHGLRSKILDQNRNKIKDELFDALGEELATEFLFETERDMRSSRYRYRLCCAAERIYMNAANS